jgi:glutaredoxin-like YruB-family protein
MIKMNDVKGYTTIIIPKGNEREKEITEKYGEKAVKGLRSALKEGALPGGGAAFLMLAKRVRDESSRVDGKESLAMLAFADALEELFRDLAFNSGLDAELALIEAKKAMSEGKVVGIDPENGLGDSALSPYRTVRSALLRGSETAVALLRINEVLSAKPLSKSGSYGGSGDVIVYTSTGCPYCSAAKSYLRSKGVGFVEKNVSLDPSAAQEMIAKSGQQGTPVIDMRGNIVIGFDRERIDSLI